MESEQVKSSFFLSVCYFLSEKDLVVVLSRRYVAGVVLA